MKITVTEALQLKNEIKQKVQTATMAMSYSGYFKVLQNETDVTPGTKPFLENYTNLEKMLGYSLEINDKIAFLNLQTSTDHLVRQQKNNLVLINQINNAIKTSVPSESNGFVGVGADRVLVNTKTIPFCSQEELKHRLNVLKQENRKIFQTIQKNNQLEIELSFEYEDIE